jgi:hypothetical protein
LERRKRGQVVAGGDFAEQVRPGHA